MGRDTAIGDDRIIGDDRMNATDELRKMLNEQGIEWKSITPLITFFKVDNKEFRAYEYGSLYEEFDGLQIVNTTPYTPEQAIAVTLRSRTCQLTDNGPWGYTYECSECGAAFDVGIFDGKVNFCPNCGRRVEMVVVS